MAYLREPDPDVRLVMEATALCAEEWIEAQTQNGVASAFSDTEGE